MPSLKAIPCKIQIHRLTGGTWVGIGAIPIGHGRILTVQETLEEAPIRRKVADRVRRQIERYISTNPVAIGGIFGFVKKAWNKAKRFVSKTVKKISRWGIIRKIGKAVKKAGRFIKKIVKSGVFKGVIRFISKVLPFGGVIEMAHEGALKVMELADQVQQGVSSALKTFNGIKKLASQGDPRAIKALNAVNKARRSANKKPSKALRIIARNAAFRRDRVAAATLIKAFTQSKPGARKLYLWAKKIETARSRKKGVRSIFARQPTRGLPRRFARQLTSTAAKPSRELRIIARNAAHRMDRSAMASLAAAANKNEPGAKKLYAWAKEKDAAKRAAKKARRGPAPQTRIPLGDLRPVDIWVMGVKAMKGDDSALANLRKVVATGKPSLVKEANWYLQFA